MGREYRDFQGTLDANLRANLTVQATERLGIRVDMNTVFSDRRQPGQNGLNWGSGYLWGFLPGDAPGIRAPRFPYGGRYGVNAYEIAWAAAAWVQRTARRERPLPAAGQRTPSRA